MVHLFQFLEPNAYLFQQKEITKHAKERHAKKMHTLKRQSNKVRLRYDIDLSDRELKITKLNMLSDVMGKLDNMKEIMGNVSRKK